MRPESESAFLTQLWENAGFSSEAEEAMRSIVLPDTVVLEIDDPKAVAFEVVGHTHNGVRIVKANLDTVRKIGTKSAQRLKDLNQAVANILQHHPTL